MTKKLEELFELATSVEPNDLFKPLPDHTQEVTQSALDSLQKIEVALPQVRGLETADQEIDELVDMAKDSYKDLMDLGMQVDSRFSAEIFGVAGTMLGHAITAKTAKVNKKLKMIELQLKKAALDAKVNPVEKDIQNVPLGNGQALDRNELLKILNGKNNMN